MHAKTLAPALFPFWGQWCTAGNWSLKGELPALKLKAAFTASTLMKRGCTSTRRAPTTSKFLSLNYFTFYRYFVIDIMVIGLVCIFWLPSTCQKFSIRGVHIWGLDNMRPLVKFLQIGGPYFCGRMKWRMNVDIVPISNECQLLLKLYHNWKKKQNQENNSAFTKHEIIPDTNQLERFNKKP